MTKASSQFIPYLILPLAAAVLAVGHTRAQPTGFQGDSSFFSLSKKEEHDLRRSIHKLEKGTQNPDLPNIFDSLKTLQDKFNKLKNSGASPLEYSKLFRSTEVESLGDYLKSKKASKRNGTVEKFQDCCSQGFEKAIEDLINAIEQASRGILPGEKQLLAYN